MKKYISISIAFALAIALLIWGAVTLANASIFPHDPKWAWLILCCAIALLTGGFLGFFTTDNDGGSGVMAGDPMGCLPPLVWLIINGIAFGVWFGKFIL